jgi:hypothetical protein
MNNVAIYSVISLDELNALVREIRRQNAKPKGSATIVLQGYLVGEEQYRGTDGAYQVQLVVHEKFSVQPLDRPEQWGDWHDKPFRWSVCQDFVPVQKFVTKKQAQRFLKLLRWNKGNVGEAIKAYAQ